MHRTMSFRGIPVFVLPAVDPPVVLLCTLGIFVTWRGSQRRTLAAVADALRANGLVR